MSRGPYDARGYVGASGKPPGDKAPSHTLRSHADRNFIGDGVNARGLGLRGKRLGLEAAL